MDSTRSKNKVVVVVGGGLVGALCVCFMAKRGYEVVMYEKREDIRKGDVKRGRSINLALSNRGRKALRHVGLENGVLNTAVPMRGRFLHRLDGGYDYVPYDPVTNQSIYSVSRNFLNKTLLDAAENYPNAKLYFEHKMTRVDFETRTVTLKNLVTDEIVTVTGDLIIGADGAFSSLRRYMQLTPLFDMTQAYIEHGYMELCIPQDKGDALRADCLHIWPRGEFMMIALPNQDTSWTVTLFMPFAKFESIDSQDKLLNFFATYFPDSIPLIGENALVETFFGSKPSTLVSIKCNRYHVGDGCLIIGDAAHAMVPFYGQGMNAGFEDCSILDDILDDTQDDIAKAIREFTLRRKDDAQAICDLATYNYLEMRHLVTKPSYKLRKAADCFLQRLFPKTWTPLYNSVTFSHARYTECAQNRRWQDGVLKVALTVLIVGSVMILSLLLSKSK